MSRPVKVAKLGRDPEESDEALEVDPESESDAAAGVSADRVVEVPHLALRIIAKHLNPYQLLQAAEVSKKWKEFFTSDAAWRHYNVQGLESGIYKHYLEACKKSTRDEFICTQHYFTPRTNLYHVLARCYRTWPMRIPAALTLQAPVAFFKLLASLDKAGYLCFEGVPERYHNDRQFVYSLLKAGALPIGLDHTFLEDRAAALSCNDPYSFRLCGVEHEDFYDNWCFSENLFDDREVALHAVKLAPCNYLGLKEDLKSDPEFYDVFLRACGRASEIGEHHQMDHLADALFARIGCNKKLLIRLFNKYEGGLSIWFIPPEFDEDWDVLSAALRFGPTDHPDAWKCPSPLLERPLAPRILRSRKRVLELFKYGWLPPLECIPAHWRLEKKVLQYVVKIFKEHPELWMHRRFNNAYDWDSVLLKRLVAIYPFDVDADHDLIVRTLTLPPDLAAGIDARCTKVEMRQRLLEICEAEYRPNPEKCRQKDCGVCER